MYSMTPEVKKRTYDSSGRQEQARRNRVRIIEAARERFLGDGYAATTIPAVARGAGVSVETVYKSFGNKAGLLKAVWDVTLVGDDEPVPMDARGEVQSVLAEPDPRKKIELYATYVPRIVGRVGPMGSVIHEAASSDPSAAAIEAQIEEERLIGMGMFAQHLHDGGHLRPGVTVEAARDVLWAVTSPAVWDLLVVRRGWDDEAFSRFVADAATAALL
jgi:AcrR family transcriptional regulator